MERLIGSIQHYDWGDTSTLAELEGRAPSGDPEAELWLGAHDVAPSRLAETGGSLSEAVEAAPEAVLGPEVGVRFGAYPYLLKILAAAQPLSIQVHPSQAQARAGFVREESAGMARDDPRRSYRDDNHKPELLCALTPFEAKCGIRPIDQTIRLLDALHDAAPSAPLAGLRRALDAGGGPATRVAGLLERLLRLPGPEATALIGDVLAAAESLLGVDGLPRELSPFRPALSWLPMLDRFFPGDVGVVVSLLLNHVVLEPGQAMFLEAGNLHSYLRGAGVELMANSDNVVRCGLSSKHLDIDELLRIVDTRPIAAPVQHPTGPHHRYESPVPEFSLTRLQAGPPCEIVPIGPEIVLVTDGRARLEAVGTNRSVDLARGEAAFVAWSDGPYRIVAAQATTAWRAAVGDLTLP